MYTSQFRPNELGEYINDHERSRKPVFLEGTNFNNEPVFTKVAPAPNSILPEPLKLMESDSIVYDTLKPMITLMRVLGIFPVSYISKGLYRITPLLVLYSIVIFAATVAYIVYMKWDKVEIVKSAEGRFEEAVIGYLFTVYLIPIIVSPLSWLEARRLGLVLGDWSTFEKIYERVEHKKLPLFLGNKPLMITIGLPLLSCATMVVTHATMVHFRFIQVIPYCYINTLTYAIGGFWYAHCDVIGRVATILAADFQNALKHIGPSSRVADFRGLWMLLSRIIRGVGLGSCYVLIFLNLYLFLTITLTIYGLLSTLQDGFGIKDVGLTVTAVTAIGMLYFICDEAHYASSCVRVYFQKKLLLVELSWMNDDAQQEINMFLRATEMNPTDMSIGGFFDINRVLFKSLLATMVTYLVVLLQFQISIPEDSGSTNATAPAASK